MAEPIIVDYIPELTGTRQPSRLRSMQDNIPEESPRGGTATLERPRNTDSIYTLSLDEVENDDVREHLKGVDERTETEGSDPTTEDLKREYKSIKKLVQFYEDRKELGEKSSRAAESRRVRLINRLKSKGVETDEIRKYLVKVDLEVKRELELEKVQAQKDQRREEIDAYIRQEKGYPADKQVTDAERLEVQRQLEQEELRRRGLLPDDEDDNGAERQGEKRNRQQSSRRETPSVDGASVDSPSASTGNQPRLLQALNEEYAAYITREGREPDLAEKWEILNRLRRAEGFQSISKEVIENNVRDGRVPGEREARIFQQEVEKSYQDRFGRLPNNMQDWMQWVVDAQGDRYGPKGEVPLWREFNGKRIIQPQNVLEWFREQMMNADTQAGDENAVNFWSVGVPQKGGSGNPIPIQTFQNLAKSFFLDEVTGVVLDKLLESMVLEVWQANAGRHLFQVNDFFKETDKQFFQEYAKGVANNYLTKPGAIDYFALPGISPDEVFDEERLKEFIENGQKFDNQQTGVAIRASLITYGYLGDIDTLMDLWGKDSAFFNNKEFVKSYYNANWTEAKRKEEATKAIDKYGKLPESERQQISARDYVEKAIKDAQLNVINEGRNRILLAKTSSTDLDENTYNISREDLKDRDGPDPDLKKPFEMSQFFNEKGELINREKYITHLINIYRESTPYVQIIDEIKNRIIYSLTQGGQVMVENPDYNPRLANGELANPDKKEDNQKMVTQFDPISLTSATYGVRNGQYQDGNWMHIQDPTGRAQRAGAKLSRRVRNAVRSGEKTRLGTPGNIEAINTVRVLGLGLFESVMDNEGLTMAERMRGSKKGWININLRNKMDSSVVQYEKDKSKAYIGDFFNRGVALWEAYQKGSLFSDLSSVAKRDFFNGMITDHHKLDALIHDGIGKNIQYFVSTQSAIDYSKYVRDRDETKDGKYRTISNAERFYGYDVLNRDKFHMIIADKAYLDYKWKKFSDELVNDRRENHEPALSDAELYDAVTKRMASLPRNIDGEVVIRDKEEREKWGIKKTEVEKVLDHHHHPKKNAWGQDMVVEKYVIDPELVQKVDRNLLWKEVLKAEIVNSLIEHRKRSTGHARFDWEESQRILDMLGNIPADAELDPVTGKYHYHGTLFSPEDIAWIQEHAKMGNILKTEVGWSSLKGFGGFLVEFFGNLSKFALN